MPAKLLLICPLSPRGVGGGELRALVDMSAKNVSFFSGFSSNIHKFSTKIPYTDHTNSYLGIKGIKSTKKVPS